MLTTRRAVPLHVATGPRLATTSFIAQSSRALMLASAITVLVSSPPAAGQQSTPGSEPGDTAVEARQYDIPAGPLDLVLARLASEAPVRIDVEATTIQGLQSAGVRGRHGIRSALTAALVGSGLDAARQGDGSYRLRRTQGAGPAARGGEAVLPAVVAKARRDAATEGTGSFTTGSTAAATGMNLPLRETPQSVTVVTSERIESQNLQSLADVAEQVPGLYFVGNGTPVGGRSQLFSRGFLINSYQIDGVNVPWELLGESYRYSHASLDTAVYDSITVVRGATGLLTGAGEPSGSIGLTRKRPTPEFQGSLALSLGRWDRRRLMVDVGGPLNAAGGVRGRLVGAYDEGKTWIDRYSDDRSILYGILEADLTPDTLVTVSLERARSRSQGTYWHEAFGPPLFFSDGVTPIPAGRGDSMAPDWTYTDSTRTTVSASLRHRFGLDWAATVTYGRSEFEIDSRRAMVYEVPADGGPTDTRLLVVDQRNKVQFADVKLEGRYTLLGRQHDLIAGFNLSEVRQRFPLNHISDDGTHGQARWINGRMVYDTPDWSNLENYPSRTSIDQHGAYLATRLRPTDALSVIVGGRMTSWKTFSADLDPYLAWDDRRYDDEFTPYLGVVYNLSSSLSAYASYTRIFNPASDKDVNGRLLDPESGKNYELGLKGEWFNGRLNASVAVFETRKDNLAVADGNNTTPDGDQAYRAESDTKGRGWEIEVAGELVRGLQVQGGFSQFRIRDSEGVQLVTDNPVRQAKLYASYRPASLPALTVGGGMRWQSRTYADWVDASQRSAYSVRSYSVLDLSASYELTKALGLAVTLDNALDRHYRTDTGSQTYGAPRNLYATLKYRF